VLDPRCPSAGDGGLELQRYLAETPGGRPIVFISGHATENEQTWAMMRGAVAFLRKPFSDQSLLEALDKATARRRVGFDTKTSRAQVCPLCHESARMPAILDRRDLRGPTVEMIKTLNHKWAEQDGLCERVLEVLCRSRASCRFFEKSGWAPRNE